MNLQSIYNQDNVWEDVGAQDLLEHELDKVGAESGKIECLERQVEYLAGVVGRLIPHCRVSNQQVLDILGAYQWEPR